MASKANYGAESAKAAKEFREAPVIVEDLTLTPTDPPAPKRKKADKKTPALTVVGAKVELSALSDTESDALFAAVKANSDKLKESFLILAEALWKINKFGAYKKRGFASFRDYVERECDIGVRSAYNLIEVHEAFGHKLLASRPDALEVISEIGWTKAMHLSQAVESGTITGDNLDDWAKTAQDSSAKELKQKVDAAMPPKPDKKQASEPTFAVKLTMTADAKELFDQAIELARGISSSDDPSTANLLGYICGSFVNTVHPEKFALGGCKALEEMTGLRLIAVNHAEGVVVFGQDYLDEITKS